MKYLVWSPIFVDFRTMLRCVPDNMRTARSSHVTNAAKRLRARAIYCQALGTSWPPYEMNHYAQAERSELLIEEMTRCLPVSHG